VLENTSNLAFSQAVHSLTSNNKRNFYSYFCPEKEGLNDGESFTFGSEFGKGVGMRGLLGGVQRA